MTAKKRHDGGLEGRRGKTDARHKKRITYLIKRLGKTSREAKSGGWSSASKKSGERTAAPCWGQERNNRNKCSGI